MRSIVVFYLTLLFPYLLFSNTIHDLNLTQAEKAFITEKRAITYVYDPDWAPFEWENGINQHVGMIADILKLIEQRSGLTFQADHSTSWVEAIEKLSSGTVDMASTMTMTESRKQYLNFTHNTLFTVPYVFVSVKGENYSNGFKALTNKKLAVVKDYAIDGIIKKNYPDYNFLTVHNIQDGFLQLLNREIDVFLINQATAEYEINKNAYTQLGIAYKTDHPLDLRVAVLKTYPPEALSIIDKTIKTITKEEFQKIYKKWFSLQEESMQVHNIVFTKEERQWMLKHKNINFTGDPNWLPIEGFTKEGEYIGIIADLLEVVEKRTQLHFNKIPTETWEESLSLLKNGSVDMLTETTDSTLASEHLFTEPFLPNPIVVIMQEGSPYIDSLRQLKSKSIVVIKDYGYVQKIKAKYPNHNFHEVANIQEGLSSVAEGKYDVMIATMALATYSIRTMQLNSIRVVGKTDFKTEIGFAVSHEYAPLVGILNKAIESIDEQTKQKILDKWVTQDYVEKIDYTLIWQITVVALLIILGTLFWSWRLKKEIARRIILERKLAEANKQITDSIEFASIIQQAFVPEQEELNSYFEEEFAIWQPRDIVGGDIYFFDQLTNKNRALLMVIDCTGHGVPGAFVTMLVKALSRNLISYINQNEEEVSPAKLLAVFNRSLKHLLKQHDKSSLSNAGFDAAIIYIDKETSTLRYAGANIPLFYTDDQKIKTIKADRHSIGYKTSDPNFTFTDHQLEFNETMQFYITSDGYLDQNGGEKGFPMGKKRFIKLLEENIGQTMKEQQNTLEHAFDTWSGNEERNDDVTVVGFRCKGAEG